ncbi:unnamed protein product [Caenorhabditis bovis]|uniref:Uncharacterized protein n=1 Tax=Caenorhabditis bovis TaxID=2654633 RepID=A0A8S1EC35_9PELO|nr:unnamed protein product [Caenorhabditis bovis]
MNRAVPDVEEFIRGPQIALRLCEELFEESGPQANHNFLVRIHEAVRRFNAVLFLMLFQNEMTPVITFIFLRILMIFSQTLYYQIEVDFDNLLHEIEYYAFVGTVLAVDFEERAAVEFFGNAEIIGERVEVVEEEMEGVEEYDEEEEEEDTGSEDYQEDYIEQENDDAAEEDK